MTFLWRERSPFPLCAEKKVHIGDLETSHGFHGQVWPPCGPMARMGCRVFMLFPPYSLLFSWSTLWARTATSHVQAVVQDGNAAAARALSMVAIYLWLMVRRYWKERKKCLLSVFMQGWLHSRASNGECCLKVGGEEGQSAKDRMSMVPLLLFHRKWCVQMPWTFPYWCSGGVKLGFMHRDIHQQLANPMQDIASLFLSSKNHCTGWKIWMWWNCRACYIWA